MDTWLGTARGKGEGNGIGKGEGGRGKGKGKEERGRGKERKRRPGVCEWDIDGHELGKRMSGKGREMGDGRWEQAGGGR